jgi:hypothetical protein
MLVRSRWQCNRPGVSLDRPSELGPVWVGDPPPDTPYSGMDGWHVLESNPGPATRSNRSWLSRTRHRDAGASDVFRWRWQSSPPPVSTS